MKTNERPQALLEALQSRGFTAFEIMRNTGIKQSQFSRLKSGKTENMQIGRYMNLYLFAKKCGVPL